jgi:hypothetical protein
MQVAFGVRCWCWSGAAALAGLGVLASCASNRFNEPSEAPPAATAPMAAPTGKVTAAPLGSAGVGRAGPVLDMAGRWFLTAPGAGTCAMTFGGSLGSAEGTIAPEGGCPGNFFTSRQWAFTPSGALLIRDHTGAPLAQLAPIASARLEGKAVSGEAVSLVR